MGVLLFSLVINVIVCVFCVKLGEEKGYSVALCLLAGFFGGFLALIVILLLPDQSQYQQELIHEAKAHQQEVDALKARIAQLESLQSPPSRRRLPPRRRMDHAPFPRRGRVRPCSPAVRTI